eukprot:s9031_g1.t1
MAFSRVSLARRLPPVGCTRRHGAPTAPSARTFARPVDDFAARFEDKEPAQQTRWRAPEEDSPTPKKGLEDVTNTRLRRLAPGASRAKAMFDSENVDCAG